jgi:hypothetical protein
VRTGKIEENKYDENSKFQPIGIATKAHKNAYNCALSEASNIVRGYKKK